jgi:hypothetical protein
MTSLSLGSRRSETEHKARSIHKVAYVKEQFFHMRSPFSWFWPVALCFAVPQLVFLLVWLLWRLLH